MHVPRYWWYWWYCRFRHCLTYSILQIKRFLLSSDKEGRVKGSLSELSHAQNVARAASGHPFSIDAQEIRQPKPPHHLLIRKRPNSNRSDAYKQALSTLKEIAETIKLLGFPIDIASTSLSSSDERDPKKQKIIHIIDWIDFSWTINWTMSEKEKGSLILFNTRDNVCILVIRLCDRSLTVL